MRELTVQGLSGTNSSIDKENLQLEFETLVAELENIGANTKFNGRAIHSETSFSIQTVSKHLKKLGYESKFQKFNLPIELDEDLSNPIRTFTKKIENGEKIIMDGANIIAEHFFVTVRRSREN